MGVNKEIMVLESQSDNTNDSLETTTAPLVTVLMPVYNSEAYVGAAISSILNQSHRNLELLVADDGSTDGSRKVIASFKDKRIRAFYNDCNEGYVSRLNRFLCEARGKYIARMDADDISLPYRLSLQVDFLERNEKVGLCGTQIFEFVNNDTTLTVSSYPLEDRHLRVGLLFNSIVAHPTAMFRRSLIESEDLRYDADYVPAEDYHLWYRMSKLTQIANLPQVLLKYRRHENQITQRATDIQRLRVNRIRGLVLTDFAGEVSQGEMNLHLSLLSGRYIETIEYATASERWLQSIIERNNTTDTFDREQLHHLLCDVFLTMCTHLYRLGWPLARLYFKSSIRNRKKRGMETKFAIKCFFRYSPFAIWRKREQ